MPASPTLCDELDRVLGAAVTPEDALGVYTRATVVIAHAAVVQAEAAEITALCHVLDR
jgi:hypothetical protein